jgi:hypothetical protein
MTETAWRMSGDYFETCNCDYLCPCIYTKSTATPTHGDCKVALVFHVDDGHFGETRLDGCAFVVVAQTPGPMAEGNWTVGLIIGEHASAEQRDALSKIASGEVGGPMARVATLTSRFAGIEFKPVRFEKDGMTCSVGVPDALDQAVEGVAGAAIPDEPMYLDNVGHPAASRLALAKATRSHLHIFGIDWDDASGGNNGHFAPFSWQAG